MSTKGLDRRVPIIDHDQYAKRSPAGRPLASLDHCSGSIKTSYWWPCIYSKESIQLQQPLLLGRHLYKEHRR
jgi:hypothetical protein